MGERTGISWTDHTFNPWWGCVRVSPGCARCYAADLATRYGFDLWKPEGERRFFSDGHWNDPVRWDRWAAAEGRRARVFCASMADVFEDHPALEEPRRRLFQLIERTPNLDWQVLTKRAAGMRRWIADYYTERALAAADGVQGFAATLPNLWLGVSAENQEQADQRIPELLATKAVVRFVSVEPMLGPVTLETQRQAKPLGCTCGVGPYACSACDEAPLGGPPPRLGWVIIGGESGRGARPMHLEWARKLMAECQRWGRPVFVKQLGEVPITSRDEATMLSRRGPVQADAPNLLQLRASKGDRPEEWPKDLRVQEFPPAILVPLRARK